MVIISVNKSFWYRRIHPVRPIIGHDYILNNSLFGRSGISIYRVVEKSVQENSLRIKLIKTADTVDRSLEVTNPCYEQKWLGLKGSFQYKLALIESTIVKRRYRGSVECPHCGEFLPAYLFKKDNWVWPAYYQHLVRSHGLRPPKNFWKFVMESYT